MADDLSEFRSFVLKKYPTINKSELANLDSFVNKQRAAQLVTSGQLNLDQAANPNLVDIASRVMQSGYTGQLPTKQASNATAEKAAMSLSSAEDQINRLQSLYDTKIKSPMGIKGKTVGAFSGEAKLTNPFSWLNILPSALETGLAPNFSTYQALREGAVPSVAYGVQGNVGQLNEAEINAAKNLIPALGSTPEEAANLFTALRQMIAQKRTQQPGMQQPSANSDPLGLLQ